MSSRFRAAETERRRSEASAQGEVAGLDPEQHRVPAAGPGEGPHARLPRAAHGPHPRARAAAVQEGRLQRRASGALLGCTVLFLAVFDSAPSPSSKMWIFQL